jgi:hypothetical protein
MRTQLLWAVGSLVLLIAVDGALAQGQDQNQVQKAAPRRVAPPPVRMPGRGPDRQIDPNELTRREQRRQQMRGQIEERSSRRRRSADQNEAVDANIPRGLKGRQEPGGKGKDALKQKAVASGEQYRRQLTEVEHQLAQEEVKHRERLARLSRIRELAQQQGDTETVGKVDKLIENDRQRYEAVTQRMERRKNAITEFMKKAAADKNKSGADADTNKP